jgi:multidrug efflux pump subunit AcrB
MRDTRATVLIATSIPVCLLATFCALDLAGRSINVISLAGLAFAVGMVVEGAIVVSGNIIRLKEGGMPIAQAAHDGARQVVPALFASTTFRRRRDAGSARIRRTPAMERAGPDSRIA